MALKRLYLLFLLYSLPSHDSFALLQAKIIWQCSGKQSEYTYFDCQTDRSLTDGCYYLIHFAQYRPCNEVCDGIEVGSRDEERCNADCPEYLNNYCQTKSPEALAGTQPIPSFSMSRVNPKISLTTQMNVSDRVQLVVMATMIFIACLLLFLTIGSVVLWLQCKKKRSNFQARTNAKLSTNKTVTQEEHGETCMLSLQLSTVHPVQAIGDPDHNMKNEKMENEYEVMICD